MSNQMQTKQTQAVKTLNGLFERDAIKARLKDMLDKNAGTFITSVINVVNASPKLVVCEPMSIIKASMVAASLDLAVDPNLGFSTIVPYKNQAQFQMMYKGFVQLAIRSGQYKTINVTEVYADELDNNNPFTGEVAFTDSENWKMRYQEDGEIVGFYAYFELLSGFKKSLYMTKDEVEKHARAYSSSYQYDIKQNRKTSRWSTDFKAMGKKTVLKLLLSKYGILSVEMRTAVQFDQAKISGTPDAPQAEYIDNPEYIQKEDVTDPFANAIDVDYTGTPFEESEADNA